MALIVSEDKRTPTHFSVPDVGRPVFLDWTIFEPYPDPTCRSLESLNGYNGGHVSSVPQKPLSFIMGLKLGGNPQRGG